MAAWLQARVPSPDENPAMNPSGPTTHLLYISYDRREHRGHRAWEEWKLANLRQNPQATFLIMELSADFLDWKGIRVYLKAENTATIGPVFETFRARMAKVAGEEAAEMIHAMVSFPVTEVRPLVDMGQVWEKSI